MILNSNNPSALILSRNEVNLQNNTSIINTLKGGYIFHKEQNKLEGIIVTSGSELQMVKNIVNSFSNNIRIVSMVSKEVFDAQDELYKNQILPKNVKIVVVEASSKYSWGSIATNDECLITIDQFGKSGSTNDVLEYMNYSSQKIKERLIKIFRQ